MDLSNFALWLGVWTWVKHYVDFGWLMQLFLNLSGFICKIKIKIITQILLGGINDIEHMINNTNECFLEGIVYNNKYYDCFHLEKSFGIVEVPGKINFFKQKRLKSKIICEQEGDFWLEGK